jgi:hypothetical protein
MRDERPAEDVVGRGALCAGGADDEPVAEVEAFIVMVLEQEWFGRLEGRGKTFRLQLSQRRLSSYYTADHGGYNMCTYYIHRGLPC